VTEPTRLLDDANAPEEVAALLSSLTAPEAPSPAKQAELAKQLASLASPAAVVTVSTALWVKAAVVLGVLGLAGAWATVKFRAHDSNPAVQAPLATAAPPASVALGAPTATAPVDAPAIQPAATPEAASPPPGSARSKSAARDSLADEEALLEQARRVASSSPSQALGLLRQYQQRFPRGQLTAERLFLSVDVLTRLGNTNAARKQADALIRAFPTSVYAAQVKGQSSNPGK
jgi:TolA-binding protein